MSDNRPSDYPLNEYNGVEMHRRMVGDEPRTSCFRASIAATVRPGDVVLDIGTGSGILSLFAAQAGAARVYAVEREPGAVALASRMIADNGFEDCVQVIGVPIEQTALPEKVDVIVSEWLGVYGVDENLLAPVLLGRDRSLKPGGVMIPGEVTAWIAPVNHPVGAESIQFHDRRYDLDLTALAPHDANEAVWLPSGVTTEQLCAPPAELWKVDTTTAPMAVALQPFAAQTTFTLESAGVNGLATWFTAHMPGTAPLTNAPDAPLTHWGHFLFPIVSAADMSVGDQLEIGFHNVPAREGGSNHLWSVHRDGRLLEAHDTRRLSRAPTDPPWRVAATS